MFVFSHIPTNLQPDWLGGKKALDIPRYIFGKTFGGFTVTKKCWRPCNGGCIPPTCLPIKIILLTKMAAKRQPLGLVRRHTKSCRAVISM